MLNSIVVGVCETEPILRQQIISFLSRNGILNRTKFVLPGLVGSERFLGTYPVDHADPAITYLESKEKFLEGVEIAFIRPSPPGFETMSYATAFARKLIGSDTNQILCIVSAAAGELRESWAAAAHGSERDTLFRCIETGTLVFTEQLTDGVLAALFGHLEEGRLVGWYRQ